MADIDAARLKAMFTTIAGDIEAEKERLCELDGVIGDADHGIAMSLGFSAVRDALAALMHLGRAVADAPMASFPAGRLADLALDAVSSRPSDDKFAAAALRTLSRATSDAASQVSLLEATAALELRMGLLDSAESRIREGLLVSN